MDKETIYHMLKHGERMTNEKIRERIKQDREWRALRAILDSKLIENGLTPTTK